MQPSDAELIEHSRQGDTAAFHTLVDRHAAGLLRLAFSLVGNAADAQDVVQETFTAAFRGLGRFEGRSSVRTWLGQILVRQAAVWRRRERVRRTVALDPQLAAPGNTATTQVDQRTDIMMVLQQLSVEQREVLVLREFEQMSYEQIAATLGLPRGTVESRLHRARAELRTLLQDYKP